MQLCRDAVPTLPVTGGGGKRLAAGNTSMQLCRDAVPTLPVTGGGGKRLAVGGCKISRRDRIVGWGY
jgi:hypothetical protein